MTSKFKRLSSPDRTMSDPVTVKIDDCEIPDIPNNFNTSSSLKSTRDSFSKSKRKSVGPTLSKGDLNADLKFKIKILKQIISGLESALIDTTVESSSDSRNKIAHSVAVLTGNLRENATNELLERSNSLPRKNKGLFNSKSSKQEEKSRSSKDELSPSSKLSQRFSRALSRSKMRASTRYTLYASPRPAEDWSDSQITSFLLKHHLYSVLHLYDQNIPPPIKVEDSPSFDHHPSITKIVVIEHATIQQLVDLLVLPESSPLHAVWDQNSFTIEFLLSYPTFLAPSYLLDQLIDKYKKVQKRVDFEH